MNDAHTLRYRVADFLKEHPPFSFVPAEELVEAAGAIAVRYVEAGTTVFREGEPREDQLLVIRQGAFRLEKVAGGGETLVDKREEGDLLGIAHLFGHANYTLTAVAEEDALLYALPWDRFQPFLDRYSKIKSYLAVYCASNPVYAGEGVDVSRPIGAGGAGVAMFFWDPVEKFVGGRDLVTCKAGATVQEAAQLMSGRGVGSIVVTGEDGRPEGIFCGSDLRDRFAEGGIDPALPVGELMSSPVVSLPPGALFCEASLLMMRENISHLCLTDDGTPNGRAIGIVSERDLLVHQSGDPAILVKEITNAPPKDLAALRLKAEELVREHLEGGADVALLARLMTEINDALLRRAITIATEALAAHGPPDPGLSYAWLSLGSEARGEQLLRTDQDHGLIYEDPPKGQEREASTFFLSFGATVSSLLEASGLANCPAGLMAKNPRWCQPFDTWRRTFARWIAQPAPDELLQANIFFDYRSPAGDPALVERLRSTIAERIHENPGFIPFLVQEALRTPAPLTFFKNLVLERGGEHDEEFDIKRRALMPLIDAGRALALELDPGGHPGTLSRFRAAAAQIEGTKALFDDASTAFRLFLRHRVLNGLQNDNDGRFLRPKQLTRIEQRMLKVAFDSTHQVQEFLRLRHNIDMMH